MKLFKIIVATLVFQCVQGQYTDQINSNRPGQSMGAFAVGKSVLQLEGGINMYKENHVLLETDAKGHSADLNIRFGMFKEQLEAIAELTYQSDTYIKGNLSTNRTALNTATFGIKYLVYDPFKHKEEKIDIYSWKANHSFKWDDFIPAVAVFGGVNLNFSDNPFISLEENLEKLSPKLMVATQNMFGSSLVLVTNIYMDKILTDYKSLEYIVTLTKTFNPKWSGFIENKGVKGTYYSDVLFRTGLAYLATDDIQLDASFTFNTKDTPSIYFAGIGCSWRYDGNYKDHKYIKKTKKKTPGSTKGSKPKKKDRIDEIK